MGTPRRGFGCVWGAFLISVEALNPFLSAACHAIQQTTEELPAKGQLSVLGQASTSQQVNVVLRVSGGLEGVVLIAMSFITADRFASVMLEQAVKNFDQAAATAIAELVTSIAGRAKVSLQEAGMRCELGPPAVIKGTRVEISGMFVPAVVVPIETSLGEVFLTIGVRKNPAVQAA